MLSLVLFDFDGTLIPSLHYWLRAYQHGLAAFGHDLTDEDTVKSCFYKPFSHIASEFALTSEELFSERVYEKLALEYQSAAFFPGTQSMLDTCRRLGLKMGVVTSAPKTMVAPTLKALGAEDSFTYVVTGCEVVNYKPHPEPVEKALEYFGVSASETLMVGDYAVDIQAGRAAGTKTALFIPDDHAVFYNFTELREHGPDFVFSHHAELEEYLTRMLES